MRKTGMRSRILERGAALVHAKGFNNAGLKEILDASGAPKGSFYFYFKSKEAFGLALIEEYGAGFRKLAGAVLLDPARPPLSRLRRFFEALAQRVADGEYRLGCPIGNLVLEMSGLSEAMRERLQAAMLWMRGLIVHQLEEARLDGAVLPGLDIPETARFILSAWQGAVMAAKLERSREPLDAFFTVIFETLLTGREPGSASPGAAPEHDMEA